MLNDASRTRLVGGWLAAVVVVFACSVVEGGAAMTRGAAELWAFMWLVPPAVMLLVWPGAPAPTVAELLYAVNSPMKEGRR